MHRPDENKHTRPQTATRRYGKRITQQTITRTIVSHRGNASGGSGALAAQAIMSNYTGAILLGQALAHTLRVQPFVSLINLSFNDVRLRKPSLVFIDADNRLGQNIFSFQNIVACDQSLIIQLA